MALIINTGGYRHNGVVIPGGSRYGVDAAELRRIAKANRQRRKAKEKKGKKCPAIS